jgi:LacI family transcriptional regulator
VKLRPTRGRGAEAAAGLLGRDDITGVVAANDLIALGVLDALQLAGLRCPEDVSVIGHNDMPLIDVVSPPLTTIHIEHRDMDQIAAKMLIDNISAGSGEVRHIVLSPKLVVRKSTARAKASE